jgi:signal transduction histidine kinase
MPGMTWDDSGPRFRPPPAVTLYVPVVISFLVQVPATLGISLWQHMPTIWTVLGTGIAAASALTLLAARAFPGVTVAVVAALTTGGLFVPPHWGPPFIALVFAIVGAMMRGARLWALISVGAGWLVAITVAGMIGLDWPPFRVALATLVLALCFAIGAGIRTRIERAAAHRAQLRERRHADEQAERTRIARELHDVLAHSLSQIAVQSGVGLHLFDREPERAREALANIRALSATGLDEVRGVLSFLRGDEAGETRTAPLTPQPQLADLPLLVHQRNGMGLTVSLDDRLRGAVVPSSVQTAAFRIVQEALTNVVRHSAATAAVVRLSHVEDDLVVTVEDDGIGSASSIEGGGVRGMRERAGLLDGTVEISPRHPTGTVVTARLPWRGAA